MNELDYRSEVSTTPGIQREGRFSIVAIVLGVLVLLGGIIGLWWYFAVPWTLANTRPVVFELRLAETAPAGDLGSATVQGGSPARLIYLHPGFIVSNNDVESAEVVEERGRYAVQFSLDSDGAARMRKATAAHQGKPLAILIDGRVLAAPIIRTQIGGNGMIEAGFTKEEAERIAGGIVSR